MREINIPIEKIEFSGSIPTFTPYVTTRTLTEPPPSLEWISTTTTPCVYGNATFDPYGEATSSTTTLHPNTGGTLCLTTHSVGASVSITGVDQPAIATFGISCCELSRSAYYSITMDHHASEFVSQINPSNGIVTYGSPSFIQVIFNNMLVNGEYTGVLSVKDEDGIVQEVSVTLVVTGSLPIIEVDPEMGTKGIQATETVDYDFGDGGGEITRSFGLRLINYEPILTDIEITSSAGFVTVTPSTLTLFGSTEYFCVAHFATTAIPPGQNYRAMLTISPLACPNCDTPSSLSYTINISEGQTTTTTTPLPVSVEGVNFTSTVSEYNGIYYRISGSDEYTQVSGAYSHLEPANYQGDMRWKIYGGLVDVWGPYLPSSPLGNYADEFTQIHHGTIKA